MSEPLGGPNVISTTLYTWFDAFTWPNPRILALSSDIIGSFKRSAASFVINDLYAAVSAKIAIFWQCNGISAASLLTAAKTAV